MGWFTPRRSWSLAGSHGRSSKALLASRARAVLLLLAMVAALAPRAFAQTTPNPVRWTNSGPNPAAAANWAQLGVGTASLTGKLMFQQSVTLTRAGGVQWRHAGISACPWTRVTPTPAFPSTTGCQTLKSEGAGSAGGSSFTAPGFVPTQAMIDNGGVVIRVTWNLFSSNVVMTQWVPLLPPPSAALVLTPASISENTGVSTVTATLDGTTSAATTITVSAAAVAPAVSGDFALSAATTLTIAAGGDDEHRDGDDRGERQRRGRAGQVGDRFGDGSERQRGYGSVERDADAARRRHGGVRLRAVGKPDRDAGRGGLDLHSEAVERADGRGGGLDHERQRRRDGGSRQADLRRGELGHGADGDGNGGCGRR